MREYDCLDRERLAILIHDRYLPLGVRTQERQHPLAAKLCKMLQHRVGIHDRRRHQLLRLVRGIAEHHTLIARTLFRLGLAVHATRDVRTLTMQCAHVRERLP